MINNASTLVLGTLGIAVLLVAIDPMWVRARKLVTLFHEGGHATVMLLTGHWVEHLQIYPREGGETLPARGLFWPADVVSRLAGYTAPPIAGLVLARGVQVGWNPATVLGVLLVFLVGALVFHRDWVTFAVIVATGLILGFFLYRAGAQAQLGVVVALAWVLLIGGLRRVLEIAGYASSEESDQGALQRLTAVPAAVWVVLFLVVAIAALITGARLLLVYG